MKIGQLRGQISLSLIGHFQTVLNRLEPTAIVSEVSMATNELPFATDFLACLKFSKKKFRLLGGGSEAL